MIDLNNKSFPPKGDIYQLPTLNLVHDIDVMQEDNALYQIINNQENEIKELKEINTNLQTEFDNFKHSSKKANYITWGIAIFSIVVAVTSLFVSIFYK